MTPVQFFFFVSERRPDLAVEDRQNLFIFYHQKNIKWFKDRSKDLMSQKLSDLVTVNHFSGSKPKLEAQNL